MLTGRCIALGCTRPWTSFFHLFSYMESDGAGLGLEFAAEARGAFPEAGTGLFCPAHEQEVAEGGTVGCTGNARVLFPEPVA